MTIHPALVTQMGFPASSVSKESACSAGDPGSVTGSGMSPGEENGKPIQYPCLEDPCGLQSMGSQSQAQLSDTFSDTSKKGRTCTQIAYY